MNRQRSRPEVLAQINEFIRSPFAGNFIVAVLVLPVAVRYGALIKDSGLFASVGITTWLILLAIALSFLSARLSTYQCGKLRVIGLGWLFFTFVSATEESFGIARGLWGAATPVLFALCWTRHEFFSLVGDSFMSGRFRRLVAVVVGLTALTGFAVFTVVPEWGRLLGAVLGRWLGGSVISVWASCV